MGRSRFRVGSMCSGYGGLEMGLSMILDVAPVWFAELDPGASKILAHHWPDIPNHGDITVVDWSQVEPVDILTAGFPCQPVSAAGRRQGTEDERWLFDDITAALRRMEPPPGLLLFENVPGLLTVERGGVMARVVEGLAALGYLGSWWTVRASDVGAPHRRERIFIVAWLDGALGDDAGRRSDLASYSCGTGRQGPGPEQQDWWHVTACSTAADPEGDGRHERRTEPEGIIRRSDAAVSGTGSSADATDHRFKRGGGSRKWRP